MTNLAWITTHNISEVVADLCDTAINDYSKEATTKIEAIKWLFEERKEEEECTTLKKSKPQPIKS